MRGVRENRIDLIRGLSLLMIFVGHANFVFSEVFAHSRGFADASELFVLMAGMSSGLAYYAFGERFSLGTASRRTFARVLKLYGVHLVLVALVVGATVSGAVGDDPDMMALLSMTGFWQAPLRHLGEALALLYLPSFLDILPLYAILFLLLPGLFWLHRRSVPLLLALSTGVWLATGLGRIDLPNAAAEDGVWFFDPFSWQLVFTAGIVLGIRVKRGADPFPYRPAVFRAAAAFCLVAIPANLALHFGLDDPRLIHLFNVLSSKAHGGPLRLLNAFCLVYVVWNLSFVKRLDPKGWLEPMYAAGRNSLSTFVTGLLCSTAIALLMVARPDLPVAAQLCLLGSGCLAQLAVAMLQDERARERRRAGGHAPFLAGTMAGAAAGADGEAERDGAGEGKRRRSGGRRGPAVSPVRT